VRSAKLLESDFSCLDCLDFVPFGLQIELEPIREMLLVFDN
jgi:hypothetical protein